MGIYCVLSGLGWIVFYGIQSDERIYQFFTGIEQCGIVFYPASGAGSYDAYHRRRKPPEDGSAAVHISGIDHKDHFWKIPGASHLVWDRDAYRMSVSADPVRTCKTGGDGNGDG